MKTINVIVEHNFKYHKPKGHQIDKLKLIREKAKELAIMVCEYVPSGREKLSSMIKIEESVMWANAGIVRNVEKNIVVVVED